MIPEVIKQIWYTGWFISANILIVILITAIIKQIRVRDLYKYNRHIDSMDFNINISQDNVSSPYILKFNKNNIEVYMKAGSYYYCFTTSEDYMLPYATPKINIAKANNDDLFKVMTIPIIRHRSFEFVREEDSTKMANSEFAKLVNMINYRYSNTASSYDTKGGSGGSGGAYSYYTTTYNAFNAPDMQKIKEENTPTDKVVHVTIAAVAKVTFISKDLFDDMVVVDNNGIPFIELNDCILILKNDEGKLEFYSVLNNKLIRIDNFVATRILFDKNSDYRSYMREDIQNMINSKYAESYRFLWNMYLRRR